MTGMCQKKGKNAENALCAIFGSTRPKGRALPGASGIEENKHGLNEVSGFARCKKKA